MVSFLDVEVDAVAYALARSLIIHLVGAALFEYLINEELISHVLGLVRGA
jgi:hypothetical protein